MVKVWEDVLCPFIRANNWLRQLQLQVLPSLNHNHNLEKAVVTNQLCDPWQHPHRSQSSISRGVATPINLDKKYFSANRTSKQHKHVNINMKKQNLQRTKEENKREKRISSQCLHIWDPYTAMEKKRLGNKLHMQTQHKRPFGQNYSVTKRTNRASSEEDEGDCPEPHL